MVEHTVVTERETDGRWLASIPDLPGVMAYGKTEEQAIAAVREIERVIKDVWI